MKLAGIAAYGMPKVGHGALEGKKVFCSDMTFDATVNPVVYEGGEPVFIDTEYDTWNMDPAALEKAFEIYPDVKVVVTSKPFHLIDIFSYCRHPVCLVCFFDIFHFWSMHRRTAEPDF